MTMLLWHRDKSSSVLILYIFLYWSRSVLVPSLCWSEPVLSLFGSFLILVLIQVCLGSTSVLVLGWFCSVLLLICFVTVLGPLDAILFQFCSGSFLVPSVSQFWLYVLHMWSQCESVECSAHFVTQPCTPGQWGCHYFCMVFQYWASVSVEAWFNNESNFKQVNINFLHYLTGLVMKCQEETAGSVSVWCLTL